MKELKGRKVVLIVGVPIALLFIYLGNPWFGIFSTIIMLIGIKEFYLLIAKKDFSPNYQLGYLFTILVSFSYYFLYKDFSQIIIFEIIGLVLVACTLELFRRKKYPVANVSFTVLGVLYVSVLLGSIIALRELDNLNSSNVVLAMLVSIWCCDSAAFFFGTWFGKQKIMPKISPNKSWVGSFSGFFASILVFVIFSHFNKLGDNLYLIDAIVIGMISGLFGQIGDFFESMLKRDMGVKDSGTILQGHGGILDRFDSLIFVSPIIYIYILISMKL